MGRWTTYVRLHWTKAMFAAAITWTAFNWSGLKRVGSEVHRLPVLVIFAGLCEVAFDAGLLLLAVGAGEKIFRGAAGQTTGPVRSVWRARKSLRELLYRDSTNRCFRIGLALNWFGAATVTGVIPIVAIVTLLPVRDWGLLVLPTADLVATFALRLPLLPRTRARVPA